MTAKQYAAAADYLNDVSIAIKVVRKHPGTVTRRLEFANSVLTNSKRKYEIRRRRRVM